MSNPTVTIGQISLTNFEIPSSIQYGGQQRLTVHRLADGTRSIELLGPDESEIRFHGIFSGPSAETRARALDYLRITGAIVPLTWQSYQYNVIVRSFSANYQNRWWIAYQVSCVVANQVGALDTDLGSVQAIVGADISVATGILNDQVTGLAGLSAAATASGALTIGTTANASASVAATTTLASVENQIVSEDQALTLTSPYSANPLLAASAFNAQLVNAASLASLTCARGYIGRICATLRNPGA